MKRLKRYYGLGYILSLLVIIPVVVYCSAINVTIEAKSQLREQQKEIEMLKAKENQPKKTATITNFTDEISSGELLAKIQEKAERFNITIERYTPYTTTKEDNVHIITVEIVLQGAFIPTVRTIAFVENEITTCKLTSVNYKTFEDYRKKERKLKTTMLVQQIIQN